MATFYVCSCYYTHNIFLQRYTLHCTFQDDEQFGREYRRVLRERGCETEQDYRDVLAVVHAEVKRRRESSTESVLRIQTIKSKYQRCHPDIYTLSIFNDTLQECFLQSEFIDIVQYCRNSAATPAGLLDMITEEIPNVYSFPVFTVEFCNLLLQELDHFENSDIPKGRPNSMNNYGILLSELGFDSGFVDKLREEYLQPVAALLYPEWVGQEGLDSHRAFTVSYTMGRDLGLAYHFDNAEVTINVCLGKTFTGGELSFGPMKGDIGSLWKQQYSHRIGYGVLHRGRHMHQAQAITSGERVNLIVWMRSSSIRNHQCPMCGEPPSLVQSEGYGDGFTAVTNDSYTSEHSCTTL